MAYNPLGQAATVGAGAATGGMTGAMAGASGSGAGGMKSISNINPMDSSKGGSLGKNDYLGNALDKANPYVGGKQASDAKQAALEASINNEYEGAGGIYDTLGKMAGEGQDYLGNLTGSQNAFDKQQAGLMQQMQSMGTDAKNTYTNTILPQQKDLMTQAVNNASGAMTLQQAMNPNNSVASGVRQMYNMQGANANRQGLADVGVLQAMGSQATAGQFGSGMPMTGGQLAALQNVNQGQAGQAMANTQDYVNKLRSQGIQAGQDQSNQMYQYGQNANAAAQNAVGQYGNLYGQGMGMQAGFANAAGDIGQNIYNKDTAYDATRYGVNQQADQNMLQAKMGQAGNQQSIQLGSLAAQNAQNAGMVQAGGTIAGAMIGGPAGAAAGGAAGQAMAPGATTGAPQQMPYQSAYQPNNPYQNTNVV